MEMATLELKGESLGAHLKRKREESGITLQDLAEKTRIRTHYLEKIEEGEFHMLPSLPYSRGFVRAYATYIGVDPDAVAMLFNEEIGFNQEDESEED